MQKKLTAKQLYDIRPWGRFHKASKHKNWLSTEQYSLAETGYQPKLH